MGGFGAMGFFISFLCEFLVLFEITVRLRGCRVANVPRNNGFSLVLSGINPTYQWKRLVGGFDCCFFGLVWL